MKRIDAISLLLALVLIAGVLVFYRIKGKECRPDEELVQNLSRTRIFCAKVAR
jgi:hypothetical protein